MAKLFFCSITTATGFLFDTHDFVVAEVLIKYVRDSYFTLALITHSSAASIALTLTTAATIAASMTTTIIVPAVDRWRLTISVTAT